jgi:hypothetical protein
MTSVHIVIPDLFLPQQLAAYIGTDLHLPALEKLLARGRSEALNIHTPEVWLCKKFGIDENSIAPITLLADGMQPGTHYWLRADPVGINMHKDQITLKSDIALGADEAARFCDSLNTHFAADGLKFYAPHPQRWYLKLEQPPAIETFPLPQTVGASMHEYLPFGEEALRWHGISNEIQMLFHEHGVNQAREREGKHPVNGVWFWGGGKLQRALLKPYDGVLGDSELARAFAQAAGLPVLSRVKTNPHGREEEQGDLLLVYEQLRNSMLGADIGNWRKSMQLFEKQYAQPLLELLKAGSVRQLTLDVMCENASRRFIVTHEALWKIWRKPRPLYHYALEK